MFIRGMRMQTPIDKLDEAIEYLQKQVVPRIRTAPGYFGAVLLADHKTGSGIEITYWVTAKALSASERVATKTVPGAHILNVEKYEIVILDRDKAPKPGELVHVNTISGEPLRVDVAAVFMRDKILPLLKSVKGYRAAVMGVDRPTGRCTVSTVWDALTDLDASDGKVSALSKEAAHAAGAADVQIEIFEARAFDFTPAIPSES